MFATARPSVPQFDDHVEVTKDGKRTGIMIRNADLGSKWAITKDGEALTFYGRAIQLNATHDPQAVAP